jgi:hypothetical protein
MPRKRAIRLLPLALVLAAGALCAPPAGASSIQQSIIQDDARLKTDPVGTLATFRELGVDRIRVNVTWAAIAPNPRSTRAPRGFNASNPGAYPAVNWAPYDAIVRDAQADGISVLFTITSPIPRWAVGPAPASGLTAVWKPSPSAFGAFVRAVGQRYSGSYKPHGSSTALPRVSAWSIWNEPNYSFQLSPQTNGTGSQVLSAGEYRGLLAAAWGALAGSSHTIRRDTILIGETAPRGSNGVPGNYGGTKPLTFLRALYCVDSRYRKLRGSAARAIGCPTTAGASRRFRSQNGALFQASGFADHPYTLQGHPSPPNQATNYFGPGRSDPNYADLPEIHRLGVTLNKLNAIYGSRKHFPIWSTEYAYRTRPPDHVGVSQGTQAFWLNWAEYLSWRQPGIASFDQYLLQDPPGIFDSGLEFANGRHKLSFDAFRMPLYMPITSGRHGQMLEVWGDVRPAHFAPGPQSVQIQFQHGNSGPFSTVRTVAITNPQGYFDAHAAFPASGTVRLAWTEPGCGSTPSPTPSPSPSPSTAAQPCLAQTVYSRTQTITIH